ncbi:MAG TPA: helix-turn-helix transcriptional regulator [Candidatus Binataceae bacterium]|nr:helix-turn-helix transcriptional regulator [Candidatus Binataceae bacterium]
MGGERRRRERLNVLIGQTYDAAQDEKLWPALAPRIAETFDSNSAVVVVQDAALTRPQTLAYTENYDVCAAELYGNHYSQRDVLVQRMLKIGFGRVVTSANLLPDSEFERTEFYNDFFAKYGGVFYVLACSFAISTNHTAFGAVHRPRNRGNYDEGERRRGIEFMPHLMRALQIRHRLAEDAIERHAALDALERSRTAIMLVASDSAILFANRLAETMLRTGDAIRSIDGRLTTSAPPATARLAMLVSGAVATACGREGSAGGTVSIARAEGLPLTVLVAPFRPARDGIGAAAPAAIVLVRDPERPATPGIAALQQLFGLTPAEATVASQLARGRSIGEIAARHRLSLNTVRTHLKNIFAKTGISRQSQLIALVLRSVATLTSG